MDQLRKMLLHKQELMLDAEHNHALQMIITDFKIKRVIHKMAKQDATKFYNDTIKMLEDMVMAFFNR